MRAKGMEYAATIEPSSRRAVEVETLDGILERFESWLTGFGEVSRDHQSFYAGPVGGRAKELYYRWPRLGTLAVAPMVFFEAFLPVARNVFHEPLRFPIADAHYAMGFAFLYERSGQRRHFDRAVQFLEALKASRCEGFADYCWGYPFDWVTRVKTITRQTPLITSTPYMFEAFLQLHQLEPRAEWHGILESIARHASTDIKDFPTSDTASTCSYTPDDRGGVINAAAYRAFLLTSAARVLGRDDYWAIAQRNLAFVLQNQQADGSWPYAVDGVRDFVDHFHTCFVMKALAKISAMVDHPATREALERGVDYYLKNLFDVDGLPRPFTKAPRLTVYKRELYDCAEAINLCVLLGQQFPACREKADLVVRGICQDWIKRDGSFRSRQLILGWDNVPMHRWAQAQMFRSLAFYRVLALGTSA